MKTGIVALVVIAMLAGTNSQAQTFWNDFRVHWSPLGAINGFYSMPRTAAEALVQGYSMPPEETVTDIQVLCRNQDPSVCTVYDGFGSIAGIQISVIRTDVEGTPYPIDQHPSYVAKTRFGHLVYTTSLFFVTQEVLAAGGRPNLDQDGTGTGLWLQIGEGRDNLFVVPRLQADMALTDYTLENCVSGMGVHYYYNISEEMPCEDFEPIFALYKDDEMLGFGFQINGRATQIDRNWFENVPPQAIRPTIPNCPQCLVDWTRDYGVISMHVYFTEQPWNIACPETTTLADKN